MLNSVATKRARFSHLRFTFRPISDGLEHVQNHNIANPYSHLHLQAHTLKPVSSGGACGEVTRLARAPSVFVAAGYNDGVVRDAKCPLYS